MLRLLLRRVIDIIQQANRLVVLDMVLGWRRRIVSNKRNQLGIHFTTTLSSAYFNGLLDGSRIDKTLFWQRVANCL